tara:strand:+ start:1095 stop:1361 length:267 start_codon:yes stop_codon:yes gene_type:complete
VTVHPYRIKIGPMAQARADADDFCHNLYLTHAMHQCAINLEKIQKEYDAALLRDDTELMKQKKLELQAYQSSMMLTAYMFEETDNIST